MQTLSPDRVARVRMRSSEWLMERFPLPENTSVMVLAVVVGLIGGLGAFLFHHLIEGTHTLVFETLHFAPGSPQAMLHMVLAPTLGGLLAGSLVWLLARHDKAHGTATVMESIAMHNGRLSSRTLLTDIFASGLLIGAGGSAGPEDPSVQVGAVAGSSASRRMRFSGPRAQTLVTSGVASAIAAIFNAPLAGVFFALEIVAGDFSAALFVPVVLSAVAGSVIGRALLGTEAAFQAPSYTLVQPFIETPLYALLGVVAALVGVALIRAIFFSEFVFDKVPLPRPLKAGLGGLLVGLLALLIASTFGIDGILGVGYETASNILHGTGPVGLALLALFGVKFIAIAITLGAVRVGGTFAPSLILGAMIGQMFGIIVNMVLPGQTAPPAAFALVGMGAVLTAVVRAPLTAILLLFEITGDYHIILAIMASVVSSQFVAHWLHPESIYTERLARRGIQLRFGRNVNLLELVTVGEVMTTNPDTVPHTMTLKQLINCFEQTHHHGFPVLDEQGQLYGIITLTDVELANSRRIPLSTPISHLATRDLVVVYPDQSLNIALRQFALADVGRLPVVDSAAPKHLIGLVRRKDIIKAYQRGTIRREEWEHRQQQMTLGSECGTHIIEVTMPGDEHAAGRAVRDLALPAGVIITSVRPRSGGQPIIPRGDTLLYGGDSLILLAEAEQAHQVEKLLLKEAPDQRRDLRYYELELTHTSAAVGRTVADLGLPTGVLIITLRRNDEVHTVHGETLLAAGDMLTLLTPAEATGAVTEAFHGRGAGSHNGDGSARTLPPS